MGRADQDCQSYAGLFPIVSVASTVVEGDTDKQITLGASDSKGERYFCNGKKQLHYDDICYLRGRR